MKNPKGLLIALGALALVFGGFLFVRGPKPIIEIKGEKLAELGPLPILNTYVTSITVVVVIIVVAYLGTRRLQLVPSGLQNVVEGVAEALYNLCIQTAGEKNGRRFFPVAATLFVFIWIANWMALTPIFNSFGAVQEVSAHHWHDEAHVITDKGGVGFIFPFSLLGGKSPAVEFEVDETEVEHIADEITEATAAGESPEHIEELKLEKEHALEEARENAFAAALPKAAGMDLDFSECEELAGEEHEHCRTDIKLAHSEEARAKLEADGKKLGVIFPYFRSMNTDLNSPLSFAIISVMFIEFWGITGLGLFKYGSKFLNFSSPIGFFVGLLEIVAEAARIISFTFRLFGNMLAGEILLLVMTFLMPFLVALPFYGLETFVGMIQAFVFFMLTVAFGALACEEHGGHDDAADHGHEGGHAAAAAAH